MFTALIGFVGGALALLGLAAVGMLAIFARSRNMHYWIGDYAFRRQRERTPLSFTRPRHVFLAICDHFEPEWGCADRETALRRVRRWCADYPQLFSQFADADGRPPQHTFFFPQDQYAPEYLDQLAELCLGGFGDVEVHLHHDNDTEDGLRAKLELYRDTLFHRHGLLRRNPATGQPVFGFIHGNWALCNSRPDGRWCGVNREIDVLRRTGCYADFTMPSAPDVTQTRTINSLYYALQCAGQPKSHDRGKPASLGQYPPPDSLLMIQGPLMLDWRHRKWGLLPRIENGDIHEHNAPSLARLPLWLSAGVHVLGRPDWLFIKLHTHGAKEGNLEMLLGETMLSFHRQLADFAAIHDDLCLHYVTAWEMAKLIHQAEQGVEEPQLAQEKLLVG